jgi:hypothetical protein
VPPSQHPAALDAQRSEGASGTMRPRSALGELFVTAMMEQGSFWRNGETVDANGVMMRYTPDKAGTGVLAALGARAATSITVSRWGAVQTSVAGRNDTAT